MPDGTHSAAGKLFRGMCGMHYQRWKNNGDPLIVKRRAKQAETCERDDCQNPGFMRGVCLRHYRDVQRAERGPCSVDSCEEPWAARGLCDMHYSRFTRTGSTDDPLPVGRPCKIKGCDGRTRAQGMCERHYANMRRHGTPEPPPRPEKVWLSCTEDGCDLPANRKNGMCNAHYRRDLRARKPLCAMPGCDSPARRDGYCEAHCGQPRRILEKYGLTADRYTAMLAAQNGACAICGKIPSGKMKRLGVDHDHGCCPGDRSCGRCVRGLLCGTCNGMIGMAEDDPGRLHRAIRYLEATATQGQLTLFAA